MRKWMMGLGLVVAVAGPVAAQSPQRRAAIQADAEAQLVPCPTPRSSACTAARDLFLLAYPGARAGTVRNQLQLAELLTEGPTPPIRRNAIEACAWAALAASISSEISRDGHTPTPESRDAVLKRCIRLPQVQQNTAQARALELMAIMTDDLQN